MTFRSSTTAGAWLTALVLGAATTARGQATTLPALDAQGDDVRTSIATVMRDGRFEDVLARIDALDDSLRNRFDLLFARARAAAALDRWSEVVEGLAEFRRRLPVELHEHAAVLRARALVWLGRAEEAERELSTVARPDASVRALLAEAAAARGDRALSEERIAALVRDAPLEVDTFALRMLLVDLAETAGERERACELLRALLVDQPAHPDASLAEIRLASSLGQSAVPWTFDERLRRASGFLAAHRATDALAEIEAVARPEEGASTLGPWLSTRAMALYESRTRYAEAARALEESARVNHEPRHRFLAARALVRAGREREGIDAFRRFVRDEPTHPSAAEAEWLVGMTLLRSGDARRARRALESFVRGPRARRASELRREAEWHLALLDLDAGRAREAAERFVRWAREARVPMERARALYWGAKANAMAGDERAAEHRYREAIRAEPLGWYALLAAQRLNERGLDPGPALSAAPPETVATPLVEPPLVTFFASLGLDREAARLLREAEGHLGRGLASRRALVERYATLGAASRAYRLASSNPLLAHVPDGEAAWVWRAAYPRPFERHVLEAARASNVPAEVLYAVMRQESAFDPRVVSGADAIGLMQLLPSTAARVARRLGMSFSRELLFRPEHNVLWGAAYLRALIDEFGVPLAFAAYNAGEHRVREWLARARRASAARSPELDRFVEDIPFEQTRNYVRRVTSSLARYRFAASWTRGAGSAAWPEMNLPTHLDAGRSSASAR